MSGENVQPNEIHTHKHTQAAREEMLESWRKKRDADVDRAKLAATKAKPRFSVPTHPHPLPTGSGSSVTHAWQLDAMDAVSEAAEQLADFWVHQAQAYTDAGQFVHAVRSFEQALAKKARPVEVLQRGLRAFLFKFEQNVRASGKDKTSGSSYTVLRQRVDRLLDQMDRLRGAGTAMAPSLKQAPPGSPMRTPARRERVETEREKADHAAPTPAPAPTTPKAMNAAGLRRRPLTPLSGGGPRRVVVAAAPSLFAQEAEAEVDMEMGMDDHPAPHPRTGPRLGTFTMLTPVRASKRDRTELGADKGLILTPVRRCFRNTDDENEDASGDEPVAKLLSENADGLAYKPNSYVGVGSIPMWWAGDALNFIIHRSALPFRPHKTRL